MILVNTEAKVMREWLETAKNARNPPEEGLNLQKRVASQYN